MGEVVVTIIDYGMGNIKSIRNMLRYLGYDSKISSDAKEIANSEKLILPGVGHFGYAMENISRYGIRESIDFACINRKVPTLGICLGMQLLTKYSEEGNVSGLGYIDAITKKIDSHDMGILKIPHMGWDYLNINKKIPLVNRVDLEDRFYFVHSFYVDCNHEDNIIATTEYGFSFDSIISNDNVMGVQFHPEKSLKFGMKILGNFMENY